MYTVDYLLKNSNLPGPRGNLELLYKFAQTADPVIVQKCLEYIKPDTGNSPEEFVGMCGILGYAVLHKQDNRHVIEFLENYASHKSWRIREAVAMSIQEISVGNLETTLRNIVSLIKGNAYQQRAVVAGLCEPKLLKDKSLNTQILKIMESITLRLNHDNKLTDSEEALRKALAYGWSVVIAATPREGKSTFEKLFNLPGKHIQWLIKENLKKNRLIKMDAGWVKASIEKINN